MDAVAIIAIFACIATAGLLVFRTRAKVDIKGPIGTGFSMEASSDPTPRTPRVVVKDVKRRMGGLHVTDETGQGTIAERSEVEKDIIVRTKIPK